MIASSFEYACPTDGQEAALLLASAGDRAFILGGGTALVPRMDRNDDVPSLVLDIRKLGLAYVTWRGAAVAIGAMTSYDELAASEIVRREIPLLFSMASGVTGGRSITSQGTIGGSACFGNPSSDVPACLVALGATMHLVSVAGVRTVSAGSFFRDAYRTARKADEYLAEITVEVQGSLIGAGYRKLKFAGSSWPVVTAACCVNSASAGANDITVAIGGAAHVPVAVTTRLAANEADPRELAAIAADAIRSGWSDELTDASYRRAVAPEVARRAIAAALGDTDV